MAGERARCGSAQRSGHSPQARENNESSQCNQVIMLVTDGAPDKFEQVFNTYNRPNIRVRVFTYLIGRDVADREAVEWMACSNKGAAIRSDAGGERETAWTVTQLALTLYAHKLHIYYEI